MLLDLKRYGFVPKGVIHIGAYIGEEQLVYDVMQIQNVVYFEPLQRHIEKLKERVLNANIIPCALGNFNGVTTINISHTQENGRPWYNRGDGASSSILKPKKHLEQHPNITFDSQEVVKIYRLDDLVNEKIIDINLYDMINIDVQGYELEVFRGAIQTLEKIKYVVSEVNRDEVYENCVLVDELDEFLSQFDFERIDTNWAGGIWGDALYVKS